MDITGGLFAGKKERKEGLSGAIKAVTEETSDKLAGTLNHMRLTQTQSLAAQDRMCSYLAGIQGNTSYLKSMDKRLATIEGAFLSKEASGR